MLTVALVFGFGAVAHAQTVFEDFEGGTVMPATNFFVHDGMSLNAFDDLSEEGLIAVAFAGALGGSAGSADATLGLSATGGVGGSQAAVLTVSNDTTTTFAFAGVAQPISVAIANPANFTATVDVLAPVGYPLSFRVESTFGPLNNGFELNFVGTGAYQTVGGVVGVDLTPISGGSFDFTDSATSLIVANRVGGFGGNIGIGTDQEIFIDNFSIAATVPEPSSLAVLLSLSTIFAVRRRRT